MESAVQSQGRKMRRSKAERHRLRDIWPTPRKRPLPLRRARIPGSVGSIRSFFDALVRSVPSLIPPLPLSFPQLSQPGPENQLWHAESNGKGGKMRIGGKIIVKAARCAYPGPASSVPLLCSSSAELRRKSAASGENGSRFLTFSNEGV